MEVEKITEANSELLEKAKAPENLAEITKERKAQRKREIDAKKKKGLKVKDIALTHESRMKKITFAVSDAVPADIGQAKSHAVK